MYPLSPISPTLPGFGPGAQGGVFAPELAPEVRMPLPLEGLAETSQARPAGESFASMLGRLVEEVNAKQGAAADAVSGLQSGRSASLHQAVIAMEEASVSFQLMVEVRNKLLESYQELMRMQI